MSSALLTWKEAKALDVHKTAAALPKLLPEEFEELRDDIARHGVREPVLVNRRKDTILDGRHRCKACVELQAEVPIEIYRGENESDEIIARALYRRHMTDDQRLAFVIEVCLDDLRTQAQARIVEARRKVALLKPIKPIHKGDEKPQKPMRVHVEMKEALPQKPMHVHVEIAKKARVGQSKAQAAIEATDREPEALAQVKEGKKRWREVAKSKPKPRGSQKPNKEPPFQDRVYKKWTAFINRFDPGPERKQVTAWVHEWTEPGTKEKGA